MGQGLQHPGADQHHRQTICNRSRVKRDSQQHQSAEYRKPLITVRMRTAEAIYQRRYVGPVGRKTIRGPLARQCQSDTQRAKAAQ